jgi:hypothetical protein
MTAIDLVSRRIAGTWKPQQKLAQYLYLYVAPSPACGLGLFTSRLAAAGTVVLAVTDPGYTARAMSHARITATGYTHGDIFQVGTDAFIPPFGGPDDFTNHSCEPNCGLIVRRDGFTMVALRNIAANEELTYDYSTHQEHEAEDMVCRCGAPTCRGVVRSFSTLPDRLRQRYLRLGVVADFAAAREPGARSQGA